MSRYSVIFLALPITLAGCNTSVTVDAVNSAVKDCETNGGLSYIGPARASICAIPEYTAKCKNGAIFTKVAPGKGDCT